MSEVRVLTDRYLDEPARCAEWDTGCRGRAEHADRVKSACTTLRVANDRGYVASALAAGLRHGMTEPVDALVVLNPTKSRNRPAARRLLLQRRWLDADCRSAWIGIRGGFRAVVQGIVVADPADPEGEAHHLLALGGYNDVQIRLAIDHLELG